MAEVSGTVISNLLQYRIFMSSYRSTYDGVRDVHFLALVDPKGHPKRQDFEINVKILSPML